MFGLELEAALVIGVLTINLTFSIFLFKIANTRESDKLAKAQEHNELKHTQLKDNLRGTDRRLNRELEIVTNKLDNEIMYNRENIAEFKDMISEIGKSQKKMSEDLLILITTRNLTKK